MVMPLVVMTGVASGYGAARVLHDVELALAAGSVTALIGRNGVGKTTLLRTIMGIRPLDAGTMIFDGGDIGRLPPSARARAGIGYVPQGRHIFPQLTVAENLETGLSALGPRGKARAGVPDHIYDLFPKLAMIRGRKGGLLSGGEQQQLAIGRALAGAPRLLLLDEPTEGVQPNVVQMIEAVLLKVRAEFGLTIILIEQYLDFAWSFADHYAVMDGGRIVRQGDTAAESAADVAHLVRI
ncbi:ABC transporter ATP-binding protein [Polymorphobacter glacialis]|uniref:ABC transporter ATP-binding protein n=1 Tax=Sandarakinorhabdus glacialis TaxID=1614636 RepID=A0A917E761_9SPHN|nr:urea ABC transporter ATP-binding subunit UrtE [Polymorphobacter glacialis]GGE07274.1 ABC transporter ATP-binding protein [Polymorphobacter glacialis]